MSAYMPTTLPLSADILYEWPLMEKVTWIVALQSGRAEISNGRREKVPKQSLPEESILSKDFG